MECKLNINHKNILNTWGHTSKIFHWVTVFIIIGMFTSGLWMTGLTYYSDWYKTAPFIHKSVGVFLLILTILRAMWRLKQGMVEPLKIHTKVEQRMAHGVHILLYTFIFLIIVSGYLMSTADGRSVNVFNLFSLPSLPFSWVGQGDVASELHEIFAFCVIGLASMHGLAALKHHFIDKDDTLNRMIWRKKK